MNTLSLREPRAWILPSLIAIASINGLIKALTGIRYFPIIIDFTLIVLLGIYLVFKFKAEDTNIGFLDFLAISFIGIAFLEMFNPNIPGLQPGIEGFRKFSFMIIGFFIGRYVVGTVTAIKRIVWVIILVTFVLALYGIKQYLYPTALDYRLIDLSVASRVTFLMGGHIRAFSTLSGPFHLGIYLVISILLLMAIFLRNRRFLLWALIFGTPQIIALFMTVTKSNWGALIAGGIVLIFLSARRPIRLFWRMALLSIIALGLIFGALQITQSIPEFRTLNTGLLALINPFSAPTFVFRVDLWKETVLPLIEQAIFLGYGTGSAGEGLSNLFLNTKSIYVTSHNLLLKIQFELGIIGLFLFLVFLALCIIHIWQANRHIRSPFLLVIRDWSLAITVAILVSGLTGAILDAYPINLVFWLIIGISTRLYLFEPRDEEVLASPELVVSTL